MKNIYVILGFLLLTTIFFVAIMYADKIPSEIALGFIISFLVAAIVMFFLSPDTFIENKKRKNEEKFLKTVETILSQPSQKLDDIFLLGEYYKLEQKEIEQLMLKVFSNTLEVEGINKNTELIKTTIDKLKINEPFTISPKV